MIKAALAAAVLASTVLAGNFVHAEPPVATTSSKMQLPKTLTPSIPIPPPVATNKPGGSSAGKVKFNEFTIKKTTDIASPWW